MAVDQLMAGLAATVDLGDGDDRLLVSNSTFTSGLTVTGGAGSDNVRLNTVHAGTALSVDLGAGADVLTVVNSTANAGVTASLNGGADTDKLTTSGNTFSGQTNLGFEIV